MNYWIFTVTNQKNGGKLFTAREILVQRMQDAFWGLGEKTPNRNAIQPGDKIIFYIGIPEKVFGGTAIAASSSYKLSKPETDYYSHGEKMYLTKYGIKLSDMYLWDQPVPVPDLIDELGFVENKQYWGSYFQGGVRGITQEDYEKLLMATSRNTSIIPTHREVPSDEQQQFALESHLEEFIHNNWPKIKFGQQLRLYETPDTNGRQFPAGTWSIDFLAIDNTNGDFVVIELKRGKTSDQTVGQLLRYMGWVKQNLTTQDQKVHGIIICHEVDEALKYAVSNLTDVKVLTYEVKFDLMPISKS